jgi:hypothetical protein
MDGIVGKVPAPGLSGWQGGESFSELSSWKGEEADSQMKTPCVVYFCGEFLLAGKGWNMI